MVTVEEIRKLKKHYVDTVYSTTISKQKEELEYINDTFKVGEIEPPHRVYREGTGRRMVEAPADHIITSNPQAIVETKDKGVADRISRLVNEKWIPILRQQNPNPFKEFPKNQIGYGVAYTKIIHNADWIGNKNERYGLPFHFLQLNPMVVFPSPEEDYYGRPKRVIVFYERQLADVLAIYPHWTDPKNKEGKGEKGKLVEWLEYWDDEFQYCEADGQPVLKPGALTSNDGIRKHLYGFCPFTRKYSGFGSRASDGEMSSLIVGDIRFVKDLLHKETVLGSIIASTSALGSQPATNIFSGGELPDKQFRTLKRGGYQFNLVENIPNFPEGFKMEDWVFPAPDVQVYQHYATVKQQLAQRCPFLLSGFPFGSSGTQQGMGLGESMKRYETIIDNTELALGLALQMGLEECKRIPTLMPKELNKGDLDDEIKITLTLKAKDPVVEGRKSLLGSRLLGGKEIDPITNLVEFKGYTPERAKEIMIDMMAWEVLLTDPQIRAVIGADAVEAMGATERLNELKARGQELAGGEGIRKPQLKTTQQRIGGEVQTEQGMEQEPENVREVRGSPADYSRGE